MCTLTKHHSSSPVRNLHLWLSELKTVLSQTVNITDRLRTLDPHPYFVKMLYFGVLLTVLLIEWKLMERILMFK
jgi:hypothetical protein